ncbi:MAG: rhodanese-like domain-containing protein [Phycisphaerae bacterium]|nr:rhodanese-like domain-containing protein [Phycisphaerae bacterium]
MKAGWLIRMAVLLLIPAVCGGVHYAMASRSEKSATHFVAPSTQSAVVSEEVAERAGITVEQLGQLLAAGLTVLIDARPADQYVEGHIAGARSFPVEAVEGDVSLITSQIDQMADVVVYCEGKECEDSARLYDILTQLLGYPNVRLLRGGMEAWRAAGLPLRKGASP